MAITSPPALNRIALATALASSLIAPAPALAQTTDAPHPTPPASGWSGLGSASLALDAGSSDSTTALINLDLARKLAHSKTSFLGSLNYSTAVVDGQRQTTAQKWALSLQQDRNLDDIWFAFAKGGLDGDRVLELNRRIKVSGGLGVHAINEEHDTLDIFGGVSYSDRRYRVPQTVHDQTASHFRKPGGLFGEESTHQLSETVALKQRFEAYPDFSTIHAHTASFNSSLNVSMTQRLSLAISLTSSYNHRVPEGVPRTDTTLFTGVSLKLGV